MGMVGILDAEEGFKRPSWDEYFISLLDKLALRSTCRRRQVACVIVKNNRIVATGYNGQPPGVEHCTEKGECLREKLNVPSGQRAEICLAVHAEENAILQAVNLGTDLKGTTLYVFASPCSYCTKSILSVGISRVVYLNNYPDDLAAELRQQTPWVKWEQYKAPLEPEENISLYEDEKLRSLYDYPGYWISDYGRVFKGVQFDKERKIINTGIWLEPKYDMSEGTGTVKLRDRFNQEVERFTYDLVAEAWLKKVDKDLYELEFIDGYKPHSHVNNLRWVKKKGK